MTSLEAFAGNQSLAPSFIFGSDADFFQSINPETKFVPFRQVGKVGIRTTLVSFALCLTLGTKQRRRLNKERKGTRAFLLGAKAAGSGVGYCTKGPRTSRRFLFWAAVHRWISPIQPPLVFVTEISFLFAHCSQGFFG